MYEELEISKYPLIERNIFYRGDTSIIYKTGNILYKIYLKKEPHKRDILDYLINKYDLISNIAVLPIKKLMVNDNFGMKMNYIESIDFLSYIKSDNFSIDEMIRILKILSDNLKKINKEHIHFSDLHHHNIIIDINNYPLYIDLDDACCDKFGSSHICVMSYRLHELQNKDYIYEDDLIRYGNLDCECLFLMLLDYIFNESIEKYDYVSFQRKISDLSTYIDGEFINLASKLKRDDKEISYPYYVGDYLDEKTIRKIKQFKNRGNL